MWVKTPATCEFLCRYLSLGKRMYPLAGSLGLFVDRKYHEQMLANFQSQMDYEALLHYTYALSTPELLTETLEYLLQQPLPDTPLMRACLKGILLQSFSKFMGKEYKSPEAYAMLVKAMLARIKEIAESPATLDNTKWSDPLDNGNNPKNPNWQVQLNLKEIISGAELKALLKTAKG